MVFHAKDYFTEFTYSKGIFYAIVLLYTISCSIVVTLEPYLLPEYCHDKPERTTIDYPNPLYEMTPCKYRRLPQLLFLTPMECAFGRRLVMSVLLGGLIGWERRQADRPAGIRTMSLVSLGSCLFTINSAFAFLDGPMTWDASRISAAIPSGVGFLGAGLIFKEAEKDSESGTVTHIVHGLTTSASLWLSSAVGVACGGELYFAATFGVALLLTLLRFGPRAHVEEEYAKTEESEAHNDVAPGYAAIEIPRGLLNEEGSQLPERDNITETDSLLKKSERLRGGYTVRKRAHLGGIV